MEAEGSLPHAQEHSTCPYPEPDQSGPYNPPSNILKIHFNIILSSVPGSSKLSFSFRFPHQNPVYTSPLLPYILNNDHPILLDSITRITFGEEFTSSLLGPNILLNTPFTNTLTLLSSLNVSNPVSHPYKTIGKIIAYLHKQ